MNKRDISALLASAGLKPQHHLGQNFMIDPAALQAIADAGQISPDDVILETGPGAGNLTRLLSAAAHHGAVLAVDIDRKLLPAAKLRHADLANVSWLLADVLSGKHQINPEVLSALCALREQHPAGQLKLVSNLPYNIASPLVAELLVENAKLKTAKPLAEGKAPGVWISRMAFTVQWEVAQRMTAAPSTRDYGPLGILIQSMAAAHIIRKIPPGAFWPAPKVNSALVVIIPDETRTAQIPDPVRLQKLLSGAFAHRRQTLGNALKHFFRDHWSQQHRETLAAAGFDLSRRPEEFSVEAWLRLDAALAPGIHAST